MLDALRSRASSWVVKILLVLLVISFVIWGIGDVFRSHTATDVLAKVDGLPVPAAGVEREARGRMNQLQQQMGGKLPSNPAIMNSMRQQALQSAIARRLLDAHANELGLSIPDEVLVKTVRDEPTFQGPSGFDRARFELYLQQIGFSEADFFTQLRGDILRGDIVGALTAGLRGSKSAASLVAAYQNEKRAGRALIVANDAMQVPEPDDAALQAYLEANKDRYQAPEYRKVQIVIADPAALSGEQQIDEGTIKAQYDANLSAYTKPEQRTAEQLLAPDQATLDEAATRVKGGESFEAAAAALKDKGVTASTLGQASKGQLPETLEDQLWSMQAGEIGKPVQDEFGWHLLKLTKIEPQVVTPFDQVREQIRHDLALRKAGEQLPDITNQLDDALAGGASLADAAARVGLKMQTIDAVGRDGNDPSGKPIAEPKLSPRMLNEIFATAEGQTSLLITDDDGRYFVVGVPSIQPARTKTLTEARAELVQDWRRAKASETAMALAKELLTKAKAGEDLEALAKAAPGATVEKIPLTPRTPSSDAPPASPAAPALFEGTKGKPVDHIVPAQNGSAVVVVDEIVAAPANLDLTQLLKTQTAGLGNDIIQDYEAALRQRFSIETFPQAIAALMQRSEP